jgi:uncharacterized membrane protein (UPF0127 family)
MNPIVRVIIPAFLFSCIVFGLLMLRTPTPPPLACASSRSQALIGNMVYQFATLTDDLSHARGLSGVQELAPRSGALFVFPSDIAMGFWMKDMRIPIDIIFLDASYVVVGMVRDARPESYPTLFTSPHTMRYTIEVSSGTIAAHALSLGDKIPLLVCH